MYPSNSFVNSTTFLDNDFNPNLAIQDLSSSSSCLFHFPSPLNQYEDEAIYLHQFHAILSQIDLDNIEAANEMTVPENTANSSQNNINASVKEYMYCAGGNSTDQPVVKKRISMKDRHNKINTARGLRGRRMRLSLDVARKFFGLQDMLGFDKASKTVEWLLKQSKMAIKEVARGFPQMNKGSSILTASASSTLDCEVVSGIDESIVPAETASTKLMLPSNCSKKKRIRRIRKPTMYPFAKESREKARERARERTKDKKKKQLLDNQQSTNLMTWSPFRTGNEPAGSGCYEVEEMQNDCEQQIKSQGIREKNINISDPNLFIIAGNWSPSALFNSQHSSGIPHEFADFPCYGCHN